MLGSWLTLSERFANVAGDYFDNDHNTFASPHPFASYSANRQALISELEAIIAANLLCFWAALNTRYRQMKPGMGEFRSPIFLHPPQ